MTSTQQSVLERLVEEAVRLGGDALDVDYKDRHEEVCVMQGPIGWGIARLPSGSPDAAALRQELHDMARRRRDIVIRGRTDVLTGRERDSFGETAYRVTIRPAHVSRPAPRSRRPRR